MEREQYLWERNIAMMIQLSICFCLVFIFVKVMMEFSGVSKYNSHDRRKRDFQNGNRKLDEDAVR